MSKSVVVEESWYEVIKIGPAIEDTDANRNNALKNTFGPDTLNLFKVLR